MAISSAPGLPHLDHLVVAASSLREGVGYVQDVLGVQLSPGGSHPRMGTHNAVLRIGEGVYLEVISMNPDLPPPARPRWFGLDDPSVRAHLEAAPRLLTWAVRAEPVALAAPAVIGLCGASVPMTRGDYAWDITIRSDGSLPAAGLLPTFLAWHTSPHPSEVLPDCGCTLHRLVLHHPRPEWLLEHLDLLHVKAHVQVEPLPPESTPFLQAEIRTPKGLATLR